LPGGAKRRGIPQRDHPAGWWNTGGARSADAAATAVNGAHSAGGARSASGARPADTAGGVNRADAADGARAVIGARSGVRHHTGAAGRGARRAAGGYDEAHVLIDQNRRARYARAMRSEAEAAAVIAL